MTAIRRFWSEMTTAEFAALPPARAIETSNMLHLRPDLVRRDKARNFESLGLRMARKYRLLGPTRATGKLAWQTQDLHESGACGDATDADAERGAQLVDPAARHFVELLREVDRYPLEQLRQR